MARADEEVRVQKVIMYADGTAQHLAGTGEELEVLWLALAGYHASPSRSFADRHRREVIARTMADRLEVLGVRVAARETDGSEDSIAVLRRRVEAMLFPNEGPGHTTAWNAALREVLRVVDEAEDDI